MTERQVDLIGGALLLAFGTAFGGYALLHYGLGTFARMEPGMFPTITGVLIALTGIIRLFQARIANPTPIEAIAWRPLGYILGACLLFGLLIDSFGAIPATVAAVIVSAAANGTTRWSHVAMLTGVLLAIVLGVFHYGLGVRFPLAQLPW